MDRAFATFQEYTALFGLAADTAAHNALLYATARSKQPAESAMLSILQVRCGLACLEGNAPLSSRPAIHPQSMEALSNAVHPAGAPLPYLGPYLGPHLGPYLAPI